MNYSSLKRAADTLSRFIRLYERSKDDPEIAESTRSSVIKAFEFTYEVAWKLMLKCVKYNGLRTIETEDMPGTRRDLFAVAKKMKLIDDEHKWWDFHVERNTTSHTYEEIIADSAFQTAIEFLPYAYDLYERLVKFDE
jgi:nucleotidyltransferase substrate binding protein (TIGR01987 family)